MSRRVFVSSASGAVAPYRKAAVDVCHRLGLTPVFMEEFDPQRPAPADVCRDLVAGCDVFLLVLAHRYGSRPPGEARSYTELEYEWAVERPDLPVLVFVVDPAFPWSPLDVDSGPDAEALARFIGRVTTGHVVKAFDTVESFREDVLLALRGHESAEPETGGRPLPPPPAFHAFPPYVGSAPFTGREADLTALDAWGTSADPMLVVEAIGGTGKSALTWEWAVHRAPDTIDGLAGRLWWSFYDRSPSLTWFLREVLAYTTGRTPHSIRKLSRTDLAAQVLAALRSRPFLLVLDGFERLLNAYHEVDPSKIRDDEIEPAKRSMIDPLAEDVLRELTAAGPSKVLISTRLMPDAVIGRFGRQVTGVQHLRLPGLTDDDVVSLLDRLGVGGNRSAITGFFGRLDNHPLLAGIVAGMVRDYRPQPGDFGRWLADPAAGGRLALVELDLTQRRTHILAAATSGLSWSSQRLLSWISVLSGTVEWAAVEAINPLRPPPPEPLADAEETERRATRWRSSEVVTRATTQLDRALRDLEERGLLWWDRGSNTYDMHPVIRSYVYDQLEAGDRVRANQAVRDYFQALPPEDTERATGVEDLRQTITIFRALVGAGLVANADELWARSLADILLVQLGAYSTATELLTPIASTGRTATRAALAVAYHLQGRHDEAIAQEGDLLADLLRAGIFGHARTSLARLTTVYRSNGQLAHAAEMLSLWAKMVTATGDKPAHDANLALARAEFGLLTGDTEQAGRGLAEAEQLRVQPNSPWHHGNLLLHRLELEFRETGRLPSIRLDRAESRLTSARHRIRLTALRLDSLLAEAEFDAAVPVAEFHERLSRNAGVDTAPAMLAYLLARTGRTDDAASAVEAVLHRLPRLRSNARPHRWLAEALFVLDRREQAIHHAGLAYRQAWADGPPYTFHWDLQAAGELLTRLGEDPPELARRARPAVPMRDEIVAFIEARQLLTFD
ncbi:DUF4062 domain-containing protein [Paractinoplanes toevensis]|uniref:DUF4062 domain-containing protein n=1 Tax=Paractinoplanes toevensis TaxID=571911 RepID=A0A919TCN8_9ACTN|nr:DUF4062 domain-containing protein [Actinoplanes toevensis]GIM91676.1 hypothetical protein Ato02nite_034690 [Actinoplanes toevensis]